LFVISISKFTGHHPETKEKYAGSLLLDECVSTENEEWLSNRAWVVGKMLKTEMRSRQS